VRGQVAGIVASVELCGFAGFAQIGEVMIMRGDTTDLRFRELQAHSLGTT